MNKLNRHEIGALVALVNQERLNETQHNDGTLLTLHPNAGMPWKIEALIEDQEGWTRRMLDFIGLPWDPKCLDFHQTDRVVIAASKWQVRQNISRSSAGRWHNYESFVGPQRSLLELGPSNRFGH